MRGSRLAVPQRSTSFAHPCHRGGRAPHQALGAARRFQLKHKVSFWRFRGRSSHAAAPHPERSRRCRRRSAATQEVRLHDEAGAVIRSAKDDRSAPCASPSSTASASDMAQWYRGSIADDGEELHRTRHHAGAARPRSLPSSEKIAARKLSRATTIAMLWNAKLSRTVSSVAALESG